MLAIELVELTITVNTVQNKVFATTIPFNTGLNVIRADNTSGKSTCVNAIAYALGLESILGPLKSKPFPKALYETINESKDSEKFYNVTHSQVELTIKNNINETVKIKRLIKNQNNIITVTKNNSSQDYFLRSHGSLGSSKSEYGFHHWLESFMGWELPFVPNLNGDKIKLYLEAIFPLFFIEQKRGWSEIQANVPNNYGIRNVKKTAIEYVLNISNFETENKLNALKNQIETYNEQWIFIQKSIESICDISNIDFSSLSEIGTQKFPIEYYTGINLNTPVHTAKLSLMHQLMIENSKIKQPNNDLIKKIEKQKESLRTLYESLSYLERSQEQIQNSLFESTRKANILFNDLEKYKQLELLTKLGSENNFSINLEECPICHNQLSDFLHISHKNTDISPMTLDQNIAFIKDQYNFMRNINKRHSNELIEIKHKIQIKQNLLKEEESKLRDLEEDYFEVFGDIHSKIKERIELEHKLNDLNIFLEKVEELESSLEKVQNIWQTAYGSYQVLKKQVTGSSELEAITSLEKLMQKNLALFGFSTAEINKITISRNTLRPEQNGYDIIAETSASDYIRTIWAFTLALLELASNPESKVKHGGFVVFDEPRQHEARTQSLDDLIKHTSQIFESKGQAIFTTSFENLDSLSSNFQKANIVYFDDYILQPKN